MSGELPPNVPGRFTGLSSSNKKYPGTPMSPLFNNNVAGGNRNSQARARLLTSKISAPRPINLPSLRREHSAGTDIPIAGSPSTPNHGWGTSSSPFTSPKQSEIKPEEVASENIKKLDDQPPTESISDGQKSPVSSPTLNEKTPYSPPPPPPPTTRAWAAPTVQHTVGPPSNEFPTAAEAVAGKSNEKESEELDEDDKDYLKFIMNDPNHKSWDEMVEEDFEDGFTETMMFDSVDEQAESNVAVPPSERFTEDYDRSYPPQLKQTRDSSSNYNHFRRNDDNYRYNYDSSNSRRYSSSESGGNERRHSSDRWSNSSSNHRRDSVEQKNISGGTWQRRPSYDRKTPYQPTVLQRNRRMSEQSARSDHSREDHAPPSAPSAVSSEQNPLQIIPEPDVPENKPAGITVVQREVMMTAAERAKKRRDEDEAEYEAGRERARQKAAALALKEKEKTKTEEKPTVEIKNTDDKDSNAVVKEVKEILKPDSPPSSSTVGDVSKPWNLVAAKKDQTEKPSKPSTPEEPKLSESNTTNTSSKASTLLTEDEQNWEKHVSEIRRNSLELKPLMAITANDWTQYASRLQEESNDKHIVKKDNNKNPIQVEIIDFQKNKGWGDIPSNITHGRDRRNEGWTMVDDEDHSRSHGRGRGRKTSSSSYPSSSTQQRRRLSDFADSRRQHPTKEPIVLEILKHSPPRPSSPHIPPVATIPEKAEESECSKEKCASKISNLLHESPSPIFPSSIKHLVGKKPRNISFMIDPEESDEEVTMTKITVNLQKSDTIQDGKMNSNEREDVKTSDNTTSQSDIGESSQSTSPAVSHGQKIEESEMKQKSGPNFPALVYRFPMSTVQNGDGSPLPPLHRLTRPDGSQQRPVGIYLSTPSQYVSSNQYMVPYSPARKGNAPSFYFHTVSWPQQQIQQRPNVHSNRSYYDRNNNNRPSYRSNRHNDEDWKYNSTTDGYSGRGSYRQRGQYPAVPGRGHGAPVLL